MKKISKIFDYLKDSIFPIHCVGCDKEGEWICESCQSKIFLSDLKNCAICKQNCMEGLICKKCGKQNDFVEIRSVYDFRLSPLSEKMIQLWKYYFVEEIFDYFKKDIEEAVKENENSFSKIDAIVPVPLHRRRMAERGYNQSEILSLHLGKILGKPVVKILKRKKYTKQQAKLKKEKRLNNLKNVFEFVSTEKIFSNVLVVDDVFTTGSTMNECAKILKQNNVKGICGFALGH